jgi:hypothetical protein
VGPGKGLPCPWPGRAVSLPRPFGPGLRLRPSLGLSKGSKKPNSRSGPTSLSSLHCPASLERPGFAIRGEPARRGGDSLDPRLLSGSPLSLRRSHDVLRFAVRALACKSGARRPWRARSAGQSLRCALPASLGHGPEPSLAWAFGGAKVHRTFAFCRLTHWTFALIRFTLARPLRAWTSPSLLASA